MGKKGKKKDKAPKVGITLTPEEKNIDLLMQVEALEKRLIVSILIIFFFAGYRY